MSGFLIDVLTGFPCLFMSSMAFTVAGISFVRKFIDNIKPGIWYPFAFGISNGAIAVVVEHVIDSNAPYIVMIFVPVVMVLEIMSISKNPFWIYVFILGSFLLNVSVLYNLVMASMGLILQDVILTFTRLEYRIMVFSVTMTVSCVVELLLKKWLPFRELNFVAYRVRKSAMLVVYMYMTAIVLITISVLASPVIFQTVGEPKLLRAFFFEIILKDASMLAAGYIIMLFCCREARLELHTVSLKKDLHWEKEFRSSIQKKALLSYSYNAVKERLETDHPVFASYMPNPCAANYYVMIDHYVDTIVHPDDRERLRTGLINLDMTQKLDRKMLSSQFRMSRTALISLLADSEEIGPLKYLAREWIWVEVRDTFITDITTGDLIVYVDLFNVEEKVQEKERLVTAATKDALTGLYNRFAGEKAIQEHLKDELQDGAFFIIDMDNFKLVNDLFGHPEGDALLCRIAAVLRDVFRSDDVVVRLGGDEFCVYAPGMYLMDTISKCLERLLSDCQFEYSGSGGTFVVSPSIGIAMTTNVSHDYAQLYQCADEALYEAKGAGKNCWRVYTPKDREN